MPSNKIFIFKSIQSKMKEKILSDIGNSGDFQPKTGTYLSQ